MRKRREVKLDNTLSEMLETYQRATGIKGDAAALLELAVRGFEAWRANKDDKTRPRWLSETALFAEYEDWTSALLAKGYDPASDQDEEYSFARFVAERAAKWGGNRK